MQRDYSGFYGYQGSRSPQSMHDVAEKDGALVVSVHPERARLYVRAELKDKLQKALEDQGFTVSVEREKAMDGLSELELRDEQAKLAQPDMLNRMLEIMQSVAGPLQLDHPYYHGAAIGVSLGALRGGSALHNVTPHTRNWIDALGQGQGYHSTSPEIIAAKDRLINKILAKNLFYVDVPVTDHSWLTQLAKGLSGIKARVSQALSGFRLGHLPEGWPDAQAWQPFVASLTLPEQSSIPLVDQENLKKLTDPLVHHARQHGGSMDDFLNEQQLRDRLKHSPEWRHLSPEQQALGLRAIREQAVETIRYQQAEAYLEALDLLKVLPVAALELIEQHTIPFDVAKLKPMAALFENPILHAYLSRNPAIGLYVAKNAAGFAQFIAAEQGAFGRDGAQTALHEIIHMLLDFMEPAQRAALQQEAESFLRHVQVIEEKIPQLRTAYQEVLAPHRGVNGRMMLAEELDALRELARPIIGDNPPGLWAAFENCFLPNLAHSNDVNMFFNMGFSILSFMGSTALRQSVGHATEKAYRDDQRPEELICETIARWMMDVAEGGRFNVNQLAMDLVLADQAGQPRQPIIEYYMQAFMEQHPLFGALPNMLEFAVGLIIPTAQELPPPAVAPTTRPDIPLA